MLITLRCWIVFLVLVTILRPNHMRLCFIRVSPLLMNLGMGSPTSNTLVSWLFDSPATHHHSHTLDPVITRNCSTSEITFQTYHSDDSLLSHLPTFLHHTSLLTPLGTASLWIPILLPKHLSPFSLGNEWHPLFPCRKIHFLLPYGSAEADPPLPHSRGRNIWVIILQNPGHSNGQMVIPRKANPGLLLRLQRRGHFLFAQVVQLAGHSLDFLGAVLGSKAYRIVRKAVQSLVGVSGSGHS